MKKILVPTDFSDCANEASRVAIKIALKTGAELYFLHIHYTIPTASHVHVDTDGGSISRHSAKEGHAKSQLHQVVKEAGSHGVRANELFVLDTGYEKIENYIAPFGIDFIVMGTHGSHGFKEIFVNTNSQKIIRESTVPVLVVKENTSWPIQNIVFASSFEDDAQLPFKTVVDFADLNESNIHLLYVNVPFAFQETDVIMKKMKEFHETCPRSSTCSMNIFNSLNEERGILKFSESVKADLIALTTHGRPGFLQIMAKSITESLANHSTIPILCINTHKW
ncbi:UspA [Fulvivirga imtechensis AK7]|uniref:UspA n=1 Tax=Fulvivirga imtechensis AK7 TaxID=1237149 RepID=L8JX48_9BACT|nr:universal stress protein [Fulvivirga imtechensis]ELR73360.1 UspA [Fulvivirga imtechensis AK7]